MTASTLDHADFQSSASVVPPSPDLGSADIPESAELRIVSGTDVTPPDPGARERLAQMLYRITGWEVFGGDERAYVSRLWAEDWDSPEDSVYDEQ